MTPTSLTNLEGHDTNLEGHDSSSQRQQSPSLPEEPNFLVSDSQRRKLELQKLALLDAAAPLIDV